MRFVGKSKLGFYPLPLSEAQRLRRFLLFPDTPSSAIDPCVGDGVAFEAITSAAQVLRYGIELDAYRADQARERIPNIVQGNALEVQCPVECFGLLYLNPPYDWALGPADSRRTEQSFLSHTYRWLRPAGILVLVIPSERLAECSQILSTHFRDVRVYRFEAPECVRYKQVVVIGARRSRREKERLKDSDITQARLYYASLARNPSQITILPSEPEARHDVPVSGPAQLVYRGLPLDEIEDLLPQSAAYRQAGRILFAEPASATGRPLTPLHEGGDTAQGNALGPLAASARHIAVLTGTLLGGYADELFNILFRLEPSRMLEEGFGYGEAGVRAFTETYGLLEKITVIEPADNACSEARVTTRLRHRPGASPLLFGRFLMSLGAFVSLEDISDALPPYHEEVVSLEMDQPLQEAYEDLEEDIKKALREHRGNQSVASVALNALLAYPDRPFGFGDLIGREFNPETQRREPFLIAATRDLDEDLVYAKERRLVEEVKSSLERGRKVQVYAVYTQKRDVTRRLERILDKEGIRVAVLTTEVAPEQRESWYERQLRAGVQVVIAHPCLVQTGLDLWSFPDIFFYETGYSIYTLRQASRRSWRIGQWSNVNVKFFYYAGTMQEACLRLMGKKLLVSLAMEGKFATDGLQAIDEGDDILMAMARELVTEKGIGESADAVWKQLQRQQAEVFGVRAVEPSPPEMEAAPPERDVPEVIIPPAAPIPAVVTQLLMFGMSHEAVQRRKASHRPSSPVTASDQLGLFPT